MPHPGESRVTIMMLTGCSPMDCILAKGAGFKGVCYWCAGELPSHRRRWCSAECVKAYGNNHHYSSARRTVRRRDKYKCVKCGSKDYLEVNHIASLKDTGKTYRWGCQHHLTNLETLCRKCHAKVTSEQGRRRKKRG